MNEKTFRSIQPIDHVSINQICSGQVVLNLATAVKELIENSIDAGATNIQIRLVEYGSELIEVVDNGYGVEEHNFVGLTLKHHTSKLTDFSDLEQVSTFGFRGEALSSLCSLCDLTVTTRHRSALVATRMNFDNNGTLVKKCKTARQIGTTVSLSNLFHPLPVRHKEFLRNLRKEFAKMCNVLYAYCLQATGVSLCCKNQTNNKTTIIVETLGENLRSNIVSVFGAKQLNSLIPLKLVPPSEDVLDEFHLKHVTWCDQLTIDGYISSCTHGCGRGSSDRQFVFINSRPVDCGKITRIVNEVYREFNNKQYPFVCLNITVGKNNIDVNVTPDKRQVFLDNEKLVLATVKTTLLHVFKTSPSAACGYVVDCGVLSKNQNFNLQKFRNADVAVGDLTLKRKCDSSSSNRHKQPCLDSFMMKLQGKQAENTRTDITEKLKDPVENSHSVLLENTNAESCDEAQVLLTSSRKENKPEILNVSSSVHLQVRGSSVLNVPNEQPEICSLSTPEEKLGGAAKDDNRTKSEVSFERVIRATGPKKTALHTPDKSNRKPVLERTNFEIIKKKFQNLTDRKKSLEKLKQIKFHSKIDSSNENVEKELTKHLNKTMFKQMKIIGQFNLGFIIAKHDSDLFIVDQHASDEKYNFETLQQTTVINSQKLVKPLRLELTVANEEIMLENCDVIRKNGFDFEFDKNEPATNRCKLTAVPYSKNFQFGKEDVDELLFMLSDASGTMCRPSRVRAMFASRACRKSIMIGTALSKQEMYKIVSNMGDIEQPWNCPHGRPTIRHLVNLDMLLQT